MKDNSRKHLRQSEHIEGIRGTIQKVIHKAERKHQEELKEEHEEEAKGTRETEQAREMNRTKRGRQEGNRSKGTSG